MDLAEDLRVGKTLEVSARIHAGSLRPEDLVVQVYVGKLLEGREIVDPEIVEAPYVGSETTGTLLFRVRIACKTSGRRGLTVRVLPHHADLGRPTEVRRIAWA